MNRSMEMNICHISTLTGYGDHLLQARTGEGQPESDIRPEILNRDGLLLPEGTHCILIRGCSFEGVLGVWSSRAGIQRYHCQPWTLIHAAI